MDEHTPSGATISKARAAQTWGWFIKSIPQDCWVNGWQVSPGRVMTTPSVTEVTLSVATKRFIRERHELS